MNRDRIRKVADLIREHEDKFDYNHVVRDAADDNWYSEPDSVRDGVEMLHKCGSAGCIIAWSAAAALADPDFEVPEFGRMAETARNYLDIDYDDGDFLFYGRLLLATNHGRYDNTGDALRYATATEVADALERFIL